MLIGLMILIPLAAACIGWFPGKKHTDFYMTLTIVASAADFAVALAAAAGTDMALSLPLLEAVGLQFALDGFRKVYLVIITFMWMMASFFSRDYFRGEKHVARFLFFWLMTESATAGVFLASDLYTAFIFFEVMSFTSFPWVIQEETEEAVQAANTYLAIAVAGGMAALLGIFMIQSALGTTAINELYAAASACPDKGRIYLAGALVLFGFGAKAGMFPLHVWLPKAHPAAPAPASALLSGILTKAGIFGVIVISAQIFRGDAAWGFAVLLLGTITMLLGALLALFSVNIKRTLACSTMSQIGFILVALGMMDMLGASAGTGTATEGMAAAAAAGTVAAARGAMLHMINHSLFKLLLFMIAGAVFMATGHLDLDGVRGSGHGKPFLNVCFLLGTLGIAGVPGFSGFTGKALIHEAITAGEPLYGGWMYAVEWLFLISGGLTLAYMLKLYVCIFIEKPADGRTSSVHLSFLSKIAIGVSAALIPFLGVTADWSMNSLADSAAGFFGVSIPAERLSFYSWENISGCLVSVAIGLIVYILVVRRIFIRNGHYVNLWPAGLDLDNAYKTVLLKGLMPVLVMLSRLLLSLPDLLILLLRRTLYRESALPVTDKVVHSFSYKTGELTDKHLIHEHKEEEGDREHAEKNYLRMRSFLHTTHRITDSMSFGLFMLVLAICAIFVYVFLMRG